MFLFLSCNCLCPIHWSQALSQKWRCSGSSTNRRCSNYIWVRDTFFTYWSATYIRGFTACIPYSQHHGYYSFVMQGASCHGYDLAFQQYSCFSTSQVNTLWYANITWELNPCLLASWWNCVDAASFLIWYVMLTGHTFSQALSNGRDHGLMCLCLAPNNLR